jgi:hypothetical protein
MEESVYTAPTSVKVIRNKQTSLSGLNRHNIPKGLEALQKGSKTSRRAQAPSIRALETLALSP